MFYTIYDAIVFKAEKNGIKEEEVRKKLRKRGFTSERLGLLKNNCTTLLTEEILTIIFDEFGLRKLEIDLMLGKVPKEYEESYLSNVSAIADLLKKEEFQKRKYYPHHGKISVYEHSLAVSKLSYDIAKKLKLDYKSAAIGGLLHDFYPNPSGRKIDDFDVLKKIRDKIGDKNFAISASALDLIKRVGGAY